MTDDTELLHYALNKSVQEFRDLYKYLAALESILHRAPLPAEFLVEFQQAQLNYAQTRKCNQG
jgi:hypothetical protein